MTSHMADGHLYGGLLSLFKYIIPQVGAVNRLRNYPTYITSFVTVRPLSGHSLLLGLYSYCIYTPAILLDRDHPASHGNKLPLSLP